MDLNVQRAARLLGVSRHTVRRWTESGFLTCTRTAGGHRRFTREDVEELAQAIGGSNHLAARRARERELETVVQTSIALVSQLELPDLLTEIARQLTCLMDCGFCTVSAYDEQAAVVTTLADYDDRGEPFANGGAEKVYAVERYPLTRHVLQERVTALVNVSDPAADHAEVRELRREDDKSLLMVPLVYRGRSIGLLELVDHLRERRYTRQELRLCTAIAGQAAVALHNAEAFSAARQTDQRLSALEGALAYLGANLARLEDADTAAGVLHLAADLACRASDAASCVAATAQASAGTVQRRTLAGEEPAAAVAGGTVSTAQLLQVEDPSGRSDVTLTLSLRQPPFRGAAAMLGLLAGAAGARLARLAAGGEARAGAG